MSLRMREPINQYNETILHETKLNEADFAGQKGSYSENQNIQSPKSGNNDSLKATISTDESSSTESQSCAMLNDLDPLIVRKAHTGDIQQVTQTVYIKYLQPPKLPPAGPIFIQEKRLPRRPTPPPIYIRQQPKPPPTPPPLVLRECPPQAPSRTNAPQIIYRHLPSSPQPKRRIIVERLPPLPPKPRDIYIERWMPYPKSSKRIIIYQKAPCPPSTSRRNILIIYDGTPQCRQEIRDLGVSITDPVAYKSQFHSSLLDHNTIQTALRRICFKDSKEIRNDNERVQSLNCSNFPSVPDDYVVRV
ncbi:hypothetical protein ACOME3_010810 [Neoechinorhynchus agilis]